MEMGVWSREEARRVCVLGEWCGVVGECCLESCRAASSHPLYSLLHYLSLVSAAVGKAGEAEDVEE